MCRNMHPFSTDYITRGGEVKREAYPEYDADCFRDSPSPGDSGLESSSSSSPTSCDPRTKQNDDCITEVRRQMSLVMRKPDFCICENKDADQLRGNSGFSLYGWYNPSST